MTGTPHPADDASEPALMLTDRPRRLVAGALLALMVVCGLLAAVDTETTADDGPTGSLVASVADVPRANGGAQAAPAAPATTDAEAPARTSRIDPRIGRTACTLLGRRWARGCSRFACINPRHYAKTGRNAETCRIGGRHGRSFGVEIEERRCRALGRVWVNPLNFCVSDPVRSHRAVPDARQCAVRGRTYVQLSEREGFYDECLSRSRVAELRRIAARTGRGLAAVAAERSRVQCAWRPRSVWRGQRCVGTDRGPAFSHRIAVIGDSITWRGTNELARLRPDWVVDGVTGRMIDEAASRLATVRAVHGEPAGLVFALGTNPRVGFTHDDFLALVDRVPASTPILFVLPWRDPRLNPARRVSRVASYASWMRQLASVRPLTCVADWEAAARQRPGLLVDGVHPTTSGEGVWARLVSTRWDDCLAARISTGA
ncbi:hypothetical protein [Nocardioides sp. SYSU D00038]|uniref:SGNH/GDSL hydrolase family protein n=1 Tax=Nocardioides sp. SYSU D00038 TaxID=2812554 RepID=UPI001967B206|nr:hypothetical protein [Nocardioides sp. SYSU D00038]